MNAVRASLCVVLAMALLAAGCSKDPEASPATPYAVPAHAAPLSGAGNACERSLLTNADIDDILREPVVGTSPLPGDPQTCYFVSASADRGGPELMVTLRPAGGRATLAGFSSGRMNDYVTAKPLTGVGDQAVWVPALHEVDARKDDVLCVVQPSDLATTLRDAGEAAQQKALGALCNKIFAAF